ncbi:MAG: hypothetical protein A2Y38_19450 [Spirochaetes bacterium GWB1_59_5]|nr:MAG: hypothetical protein A2Y38_19450 [Spirochaetes bacterium GWB1_59_5]
MPIARPPVSPATETLNVARIRYTIVVAPPSGLGANLAVAVQEIGSTLTAVLCGALPADLPERFAGFTATPIAPGASVQLVVGRGSLFTPSVEGGVPLVSGLEVFLALTPGEVTQTPITDPTALNLRLGYAVSATEMILTTDAYYQWGG